MVQLLIGSYTHKDKKGIYHYEIDEQNITASHISSYDELDNPSYLIVDYQHSNVYAVSEKNGLQGGGIAKYSFDEDMRLCYQSMQLSLGDDPCHLTKHHEDLIICNYSTGNLSIYSTGQQSQIYEANQTIWHTGSGMHQERQACAHIHFAESTPDDAFVAVVDLGMDTVFFYEEQKGYYREHSRLCCAPGSGPRHLVFLHYLSLIYIVNELSSTVSVYRYSNNFSEFKHIQTLATIPSSFKENNQCAAIVISQDLRYLYISNRGHDSIAIYGINDVSGELTLITIVKTEGQWPRDCALSPSQNFLFVANEKSDSVCIFKRDTTQGTLTYHSAISVSEPTCIVFINDKIDEKKLGKG